MINFSGKPCYLACGATDMRKSINGLAVIVEGSFKLDPFNGALFVFCNGSRDRLKILEWDGDGFWLYFKRLERGHFRWPDEGETATMDLSGEELAILLGGSKVELKLRRKEVTVKCTLCQGQNGFLLPIHKLLMVTLNDTLNFNTTVVLPVGLSIITKLSVGGSVTGFVKITPITRIGELAPLKIYADEYGNYPYYDSNMFKTENYRFHTEGGVILQPKLSLSIEGDYGVASVEVGGNAEFFLVFTTDHNDRGTVTLNAHISVNVLGFDVYSHRFVNWSTSLFGSSASLTAGFGESGAPEQYGFAPISRDYLAGRSGWLGTEPLPTADGSGSSGLTERTLLGGLYPDPDIQLMRIDEDSILMVFIDDQPGRTDENRAALYYSISNDNGATYSEPALIADDGTLDSNPRLVDLGGKILCLYSSLGKVIQSGTCMEEILEANDLEMMFFDKATGMFEGEATEVTRYTGVSDPENEGSLLGDYTSDDSGNAVYDPTSGRTLLIYTKSDYTSDQDRTFSAEDLFDTKSADSSSYSTIAYRIYDSGTGQFLPYDVVGYPAGLGSESEQAEWNTYWYGQKFLDTGITDSSLPGGGITDPLAYDLTAARKGQTAYIAYTADMDSDYSTTEDRDIYLTTYNFADNTFTKPVKASDIYDGVPPHADGKPQLVLYEDTMYLFYTADTAVCYNKADVLLSSVEEGSGGAGAGEGGEIIEQMPSRAFAALEENDGNHPLDDYRVLVGDDGKLYLIWTEETLRYAEGVEPGTQESLDSENTYHEDQVFASVYYEDYNTNLSEVEHTVDESMTDPDVEYGRWSEKVQLTAGPGSYNDISGDVMADGRILLAAKKCEKIPSGEQEDAPRLNDPDTAALVAMTLTPAVLPVMPEDAISFDPAYPAAGDTVRISAAFANQGLMPFIRPTVDFYAIRGGIETPVGSVESDKAVYGGGTGSVSVEWEAPDQLNDIQIIARLRSGDSGTVLAESGKEFPYGIDLEYNLFKLKYVAQNYYKAYIEALNTGNKPLADADAVISRVGSDGAAQELKRVRLDGEIAAGGLFTVDEAFELPSAGLEPMTGVMGGSADIEVRIEKDGVPLIKQTGTVIKDISGLYGERISAASRVDVSETNLSMLPGHRKSIRSAVYPAELAEKYSIVYRSSNPSAASVSEEGEITAHAPGSAVVTAYAVPNVEIRTLTLDGHSLQGDILDNLALEDCRSGSVQVAVSGSPSGSGGGTPTAPGSSGPDTAAITVKAGMSREGKASASVSDKQINDAVSKALVKRTEAGGAGTMDIRINVDAPADARTVETVISPTAVKEIADHQFGLTVASHVAYITFADKALGGILAQSEGDIAVTASLTDKSALPENARAAVGDHPVFDFSVTGGGRAISQFDGNVTVSVPYVPSENEDPNAVIIYFINDSGELEIIGNCRYDAETGRVVFTVNHFSKYAVGYNKAAFNDVQPTAWYNRPVSFIAARNITAGTGGGSFSPDAKLTRGQFITMLLKAYGVAPDANPKDNFTDAGNVYYTGYLAAAKRLGISAGIGNNLYGPEREITRQEMFTLLYNALRVIGQLPQGDSGKTLSDFADAGQIDSWAKEAMALLVETGTVGGNAGKLTPASKTTRAEMAQVLYSLLAK